MLEDTPQTETNKPLFLLKSNFSLRLVLKDLLSVVFKGYEIYLPELGKRKTFSVSCL